MALDECARGALLLETASLLEAGAAARVIADLYDRGEMRERQAVLRVLAYLPQPDDSRELAVEACRQRKRVRFTTTAELVNELIEAKNQSELNRITNRWLRYELIVIDEMAYVAMPESAVELLFQVISGRAERAAVIVTTNLLFSEWNTMFSNARLCKAMLDRLTDQAHIIDTGKESYRFRRTLEKKKGAKG